MDIKELLIIAVLSSYWRVQTDIQCRLTQGIRGITCPHAIEDETEAATFEIDKLFLSLVKFPNSFDVSQIARKMFLLMDRPSLAFEAN